MIYEVACLEILPFFGLGSSPVVIYRSEIHAPFNLCLHHADRGHIFRDNSSYNTVNILFGYLGSKQLLKYTIQAFSFPTTNTHLHIFSVILFGSYTLL